MTPAAHSIIDDMSTATSHIEIRVNRAGQTRAFLVGTRTRVQDIAMMAELRGDSPDEIVRSLPHLTLSQVHSALAYFFEYRDAIVQEMKDDARFVEEFSRTTGPGPLALKRLAQDADGDAFSS